MSSNAISVHLDLPGVRTDVRFARTAVMSLVVGAVSSVIVDAAVLLVSELVTNALMHTDGPSAIDLVMYPGRFRVDVWDGSAELPRVCASNGRSSAGLGLDFVDQLASRWGVEPKPQGKAVWFELDI